MSKKYLLWMDLEMTGLDEKKDQILEIAAIITDYELNPIDQKHYIVYQPQAVLDEMIAEGQRWFLGLVADRRKIVTGDVPGLEQGRVYSGRRALELKLIDQIGGELEAMKWLTDTRKIAKNLRIVDWKPKRPGDWPLAGMTAGFIAEIIGQTGERVIGEVPERVMRGFGTLSLDGLVSVWQPPKNEQ